MNVRRFSKFLAIGLAVGVIAGWLITGDQMTIGQTNGNSWQDKTFALAQHPSTGAPSPGLGASWLPFDFGHKSTTTMVVWDGGPSGRRALVSIWCSAGTVDVEWDGNTIRLYGRGTGTGNTTTIYSSRVVLDYVGAWTSAIPVGEYVITVDIGE